ncbi:hypothetical protein ACB092_02G036200 [Castanea dentata]
MTKYGVEESWEKLFVIPKVEYLMRPLCFTKNGDVLMEGNRLNTHFSKKGWANIIATFEKKTGKEYPRAKYKHKWDNLKKDWVLWNKLKGSETGLGWDAAKGTIAAIDEWRFPKLQNSKRKFSPNDDDDVHEDETPNLTQPPNPTQNKGKKRVLPSSTQSKGKKGGMALQLTQQLSRICDVVELRNSVFLVEPSSTIRNVIKCVCTLDGIEKGSELYLMIARIF